MKSKDNKTKYLIYPEDLTYPPSEDIYVKAKEEPNIDPEDITKAKAPNEDIKAGKRNEKYFDEDVSGSDLDIPDAVLDPDGNEDEENDFYSLGGDEHNDLEEDKGS